MPDSEVREIRASSGEEKAECVKARLQEEGREARNLVAYSLPLQDPVPESTCLPPSG